MIIVVIFILNACTSPTTPTKLRERNEKPKFDVFLAKDVFAAGIKSISEKYIHAIDLSEIVIEGLRGLESLDSRLVIKQTDNYILLNIARHAPVQHLISNNWNIQQWAYFLANTSKSAWVSSAKIRAKDQEQIYEAVFDGMLSKLDAFSRYSGAEEASRNRERRDGFGGVGLRFKIHNSNAQVTDIIPNTPADFAGIKVGDEIIYVGQIPIQGLQSRHIKKQLRGPIGSDVKLTLKRKQSKVNIVVNIMRERVVSPSVDTRISGHTGIIKITTFNQGTSSSVDEAIKTLTKNKKITSLIIDLRGNPGGLLRQAVKVADLLLSEGVIVTTRGRHVDSLRAYKAKSNVISPDIPLAILLDGRSASAAEIVAAALQDQGRAILIGSTSFGKGTVQTVVRLPNEGEITLTWSRLIAPSGYIINGLGIKPTVCTSISVDNEKNFLSNFRKTLKKRQSWLDDWRYPGQYSKIERERLRDACPPKTRKDFFDINVARRILSEKSLYTRGVDTSAFNLNAKK